MKIGSLFSGAGGLDMAVEQAFSGRTVWHSEVDPAASKVLAVHWPDTPNHGDITAMDWRTVEPVDVLCGGWPCQPFSLAGKRKGAEDERALWPHLARVVRVVRPRYVVLENVAAVIGPELQRVVSDLAASGYVGQYRCLRASDVGAPHQRNRLFLVAADAARGGRPGRVEPRPHVVDHGSQPPHGDSPRGVGVELLPTDARSGRNQSPSPGAAVRPSLDMITALLPTPSCADGGGGHLTRSGDRGGELLLPGIARAYGTGALLPTPSAADGSRGQDFARAGRDGSGGDDLVTLAVKATRDSRWGQYAPAIRRWEHLTRPAPSPTEPNTRGNPRLNPAFSEWMQGWPDGWVTAPELGLSRNDQLRCIGNGVVPQQAAAALRWLLQIEAVAA